MLIKHEKSKFTQRLSDIFKWSRDKIPSASRDHINTILDAEYIALLQEIDGLTNKKQSCTVSFKNVNFSKPVVSSDEVSSLLQNHSSEVIDKYVRHHDKTKKYKNLTPEEFLTYLTEIIVTKCNTNECNCGRHKVTVNRDGVEQENKDAIKEVQPGKFEFDSQMLNELGNEREKKASKNGYESYDGALVNENVKNNTKIGSEQARGSIGSKKASELSGGRNNGSELSSGKNASEFRSSFDRSKERPSLNGDRASVNGNRESANENRRSFDENRSTDAPDQISYGNNRRSFNENQPTDQTSYGNRRSFDQNRPMDRIDEASYGIRQNYDENQPTDIPDQTSYGNRRSFNENQPTDQTSYGNRRSFDENRPIDRIDETSYANRRSFNENQPTNIPDQTSYGNRRSFNENQPTNILDQTSYGNRRSFNENQPTNIPDQTFYGNRRSFNENRRMDKVDENAYDNVAILNEYRSTANDNGLKKKGCNHKLCTCKPFKATKEIGTDRAKLSVSENVQADAGSTKLNKDKSALVENNTLPTNGFQRLPTIQPTSRIEPKPKLENEGIQTSDCTIDPNCNCCKKYATVEENKLKSNLKDNKVVMKDQDTKMSPDTAVQTSRLCVPKNYDQLMQDPKRKFNFTNCPLEKKDCMCDAYDAKLAIERGWVLPSSEMCMQTGKKSSKKPKQTKSDTDLTSVSSMEPPTKTQKTQFQKAKPMSYTASELSTDFEDKAKKPTTKNGKKSKVVSSSDESEIILDEKAAKKKKKEEAANKKKKEQEDKLAKKQKEKEKADKKKKKEKEKKDKGKDKKNGKDKKDKKVKGDSEDDEVEIIRCPTCASDTSLNTVLEERKKKKPAHKVKYDETTDSDSPPSKKKAKKDQEKPKKEKEKPKKDKEAKKGKKEKEECEAEEEVTGCFGKKKKRPREKCEEWCDAECNRAIQTKPPLIANKKDQANLAGGAKAARKDSVASVSSDASGPKSKRASKSGSTIMCGKCGKEKKGCCQGCRNTIVVQPGSSRNLQDSNSLRLLIKMQAKDTNRRFDDIMTELNSQKTEIHRLNSMYQCMLCCENQKTSSNDLPRNNNNTNRDRSNGKDRNDRRNSNNYNNNNRKGNVCSCDEERKRYGPEGTTVAINRCEVCHFDIARGQFPNFIRETFSRDTYSGCCCEDCESEKFRKDMINQSRQHLPRKPFSFSNDDICRPTLYGKRPPRDDFYEYADPQTKSNEKMSHNFADREIIGDQTGHYPQNREHVRMRPKTRIPFGETSMADSKDLDDRNKPLYTTVKRHLSPIERRDYLEAPPRLPIDPRTGTDYSRNVVQSKTAKNYNNEDFIFDSESERFQKSNDTCRDRFYTWLKSSWAKAEECQKNQREMHQKKAATRRSKIKSGLIKMLRCRKHELKD